ncbi:MAG: hypothetical protein ACTSXE_02695 [Candidatus Thorarchaeota archaeon]
MSYLKRTYLTIDPVKKKSWYIARHRDMWDWLSHNPESLKEDWPGWDHIEGQYYEDCFLCHYQVELRNCEHTGNRVGRLFCDDACLLQWTDTEGTKICTCEDNWHNTSLALFTAWMECNGTTNPEKKKTLAELIRDLKPNEDSA